MYFLKGKRQIIDALSTTDKNRISDVRNAICKKENFLVEGCSKAILFCSQAVAKDSQKVIYNTCANLVGREMFVK